MERQWDNPHDSKSGPVTELDALQQEQDKLWSTLRGEEDPDLRMSLLSRFSENRAEILRLGEQVGGIEGAGGEAQPVGYRVELSDPARPVQGSRYLPTESETEVSDYDTLETRLDSDLVEGLDQERQVRSPTTTPIDFSPVDDQANLSERLGLDGGASVFGEARSNDSRSEGDRLNGHRSDNNDANGNHDSTGNVRPPSIGLDEFPPVSGGDSVPRQKDEVESPGLARLRRGRLERSGIDAGGVTADNLGGALTAQSPQGPSDPVDRPGFGYVPDDSHDDVLGLGADDDTVVGLDLVGGLGRLRDRSEPADPVDPDLSNDGNRRPGAHDPAGRARMVGTGDGHDGLDGGRGADRLMASPLLPDRSRDLPPGPRRPATGPGPGPGPGPTEFSFDSPVGQATPASNYAGLSAKASLVTASDGSHDRDPSGSQDLSRRVAVIGGVFIAVLAVAWLFLANPFGQEGEQNATGDISAEPTGVAGPTTNGRIEQITDVLHGLGLNDVVVEERGSVLHLIGTAPSEGDRAAALGAVGVLAGDLEVDDTAFTVDTVEEQGAAPVGAASLDGRHAALQNELNRVVASTPLNFAVGQTAPTELHLRILNTISTIMTAYPDLSVTVVGFTDDSGSDEANRELSLARANAVRDYLLSQGVPEANLTIEPRGEATSTGSEALANLERRVEFEVVAPAGAPVAAGAEQVLKVAIVAPSDRADLAFTQSMVDAIGVVAAERGNVEVSITDNTFVPDEAAAAIRGYAAEGYDLVIAHGSQFGGPLLEIAPDFPEVAFAWGTASDTFGQANVYAYDVAAGEGGYVLGTMASLLSQSGVVGVVGPIEVGDAERYVTGFKAGAEAQSDSVAVHVAYTGSFSDLTLAAEAAKTHVEAGADVMTGSAQMVVGAVSVASENNALWFGTQANQSSLAPDLVVASQVYHWEVILRLIVNDIDSGTPKGKSYSANLANGGLVVEYNPAYAVPDGVRQRADEVAAGIANGSIQVTGAG